MSNVASFGNGGLGNQMCNFASLFALYKDFGMPSYLEEHSFRLLQNTFLLDNGNSTFAKFPYFVTNLENISPLSWVHISNNLLMYNRSELLNRYKYSWLIKLNPYVCDIKGFFPYLDELRNSYFRFQPKVIKHGKYIMQNLQRQHGKNTKFVSIHARMTDMEYHLKTVFGISMASKEYFTRAMSQMRRKIGPNVTFLAFSDDIQKAKDVLLTKENDRFNIEFPLFDGNAPSPRITLALLALCKGSILTYSTFGLWGALLREHKIHVIMPKEIIGTDIAHYAMNSALLHDVNFV